MNGITNTIKGAAARCGLSGLFLSKVIGMPYQTLMYRYRNPETWKFYEWASVLRHIEFNETELETIRKEITTL